MPPKQQRDAGLDQQLTEAPFLYEDDHAVEGQHDYKEVRHPFVGRHVIEVQQVVRRERQQRRRERNPPVGREAAERQVRQDCCSSEEQQHQHSGGGEPGRRVLSEGQSGQFHT